MAGDGFLVLSQALRRAGRPIVPLPTLGSPFVGGLLRRTGVVDMDSAMVRFLTYGRGVDTTRMRTQLKFDPVYSTVATFDAFAAARTHGGLLDRDRIRAVEHTVRGVLTGEDARGR